MHSAGKSIVAVDLFCGIGGLTHGLARSGIPVSAGIDIDEKCRHIYKANNENSKFIHKDIRDISFSELEPFYRGADIKLLVGCAPCQPFSAHNRKGGSGRIVDCSLVQEFARLVEEGLPEMVSMENVPGLAKHRSFEEFTALLASHGYEYVWDILSCFHYGIPQKRRRLVLLASRLGEITLPQPTAGNTMVRDVLSGLPVISDGQSAPCDPAHVTLPLSEKNRRRMLQSKPGGSWKDWDEREINECHKRAYYPASYGRMQWDAPAPTITTQFCYFSTGRFGHPEQHRTISIREGALLQTFPRDYIFSREEEPLPVYMLARHIGNAVPVKLAQVIGSAIMEGANV